MRIITNILFWLLSLIGASIVAALFVVFGIVVFFAMHTADLQQNNFVEVVSSIFILWIYATLYIATAMFLPALVVDIVASKKYKKPDPFWFGVAGIIFGLLYYFLIQILFFPTENDIPMDLLMDVIVRGWPILLGVIVGGYVGGRLLAKFRTGVLHWS